MKRLLLVAAVLLLNMGWAQAQNVVPIKEKEVNIKYVQDLKKQAPHAKDVQWEKIDDDSFHAKFINDDNERQSITYSNKGSETHFYIEEQYYPKFICDTVKYLYPKHNINEVFVVKVKNTLTYRATISINKKRGILWWRKTEQADPKTLNFETSGKFLNAIDETK